MTSTSWRAHPAALKQINDSFPGKRSHVAEILIYIDFLFCTHLDLVTFSIHCPQETCLFVSRSRLETDQWGRRRESESGSGWPVLYFLPSGCAVPPSAWSLVVSIYSGLSHLGFNFHFISCCYCLNLESSWDPPQIRGFPSAGDVIGHPENVLAFRIPSTRNSGSRDGACSRI